MAGLRPSSRPAQLLVGTAPTPRPPGLSPHLGSKQLLSHKPWSGSRLPNAQCCELFVLLLSKYRPSNPHLLQGALQDAS